jgi:hypothetical protein
MPVADGIDGESFLHVEVRPSETNYSGETSKMTPKTISITPPTKFTPTEMIPNVALSGLHVVVNGKKLSLMRKARAYRVIRAFFSSESPAFTTSELIELLEVEEGMPRRCSERAQRSKHAALVRMFSRMREEFGRAFNSGTPSGFTWFHFDRDKNHWVLFKMPATGADGLNY